MQQFDGAPPLRLQTLRPTNPRLMLRPENMRTLTGAPRTISIRSNELGPSAPRPFAFFYLTVFDFDQFKRFDANLQVTTGGLPPKSLRRGRVYESKFCSLGTIRNALACGPR